MPRPSKLTEAEKQEIRELHDKIGVPYRDLAQKYDVHFNTILRICEPDTYAKHLEKARIYQKTNQKEISAQKREKTRRYYVNFKKTEDAAIIQYIESKENINQYFRELVLKDMQQKSTKLPD